MKFWRSLACLLLCAGIVLAPALADARAGATFRSGGGSSYSSMGSRGTRTYSSDGAAPIQRSMTTPSNPSYGTSGARGYYGGYYGGHPFLSGLAGGFFGSWIGSMLFPHWGYGYGGGYYGGGIGIIGSLFTWIIIIALIWGAIRFFRRSWGPVAVTDYQQPYGAAVVDNTPSSAPLNVSQADFQAFEAILRTVQTAWGRADLATLRNYVTPEMLSYFSEQLTNNQSQGVQNRVDQVQLVNGDVREAWDEGNMQYATALLHWRAIDYTVRLDNPGVVVDGNPNVPTETQEMWTFARSPGGHWLLSAIQQV